MVNRSSAVHSVKSTAHGGRSSKMTIQDTTNNGSFGQNNDVLAGFDGINNNTSTYDVLFLKRLLFLKS